MHNFEFRDPDVMPLAKVRRFERVEILKGPWLGRTGTAIWCDPPNFFDRRAGAWMEWIHVVHVDDPEGYRSFGESGLRPTGVFDPEDAHRGHRHEISFDCVLGEDSSMVEGSYRVPGRHWEVFGFGKPSAHEREVPDLRHEFSTWPSGATVLVVDVPRTTVLNLEFMIRAMAGVFGSEDWVEVRGPDSMILR